MTLSITKTGQTAHASITSPSKNYSSRTEFHIQNDKYMHQFFVAPMPRGATIISAKLKLYNSNRNWPAGSVTVTLERITSKWDATKLNYNNRPSVTASLSTPQTKSAPVAKTEWVFDITADMQAVANGGVWWGYRIKTNVSSHRWLSGSKAADSLKPVLEVEWSTLPQAPVDMYPSAGRAVAAHKPLLRINFNDPSGSHTMQSMQVQIHSAATWTTPDFDSGEVANTTGLLDLNTTAFAGINAGQTKYWRARTKDETGQWSGWSRIESWTRVNLGTVTIVYPAVAPNDYVEEPTPIFAWTFSGTQKAYRVWISKFEDPAIPIWDTGKITSGDLSLHPPEGVLTELNGLYQLNVDIWDNVNRESNSNPAYARATRTFTYKFAGSVTAVNTLTLTKATDGPWVRLRANRATPPDSFTIYDNNVPILTDLDPALMTYAAGAYEIWIRQVAPRINHTYMMVPVVNGSVPTTNPTVQASIRPNAAWISQEGGLNAVPILSYTADLALASDSASKQVKDANTTVLIKGALGGYQGTFSGTIASQNGVSADTFRNRLKAIREGGNPIVYLAWANECIIAAIDEITWVPVPKTEEVIYRVSFKVYERFSLT